MRPQITDWIRQQYLNAREAAKLVGPKESEPKVSTTADPDALANSLYDEVKKCLISGTNGGVGPTIRDIRAELPALAVASPDTRMPWPPSPVAPPSPWSVPVPEALQPLVQHLYPGFDPNQAHVAPAEVAPPPFAVDAGSAASRAPRRPVWSGRSPVECDGEAEISSRSGTNQFIFPALFRMAPNE